MVGVNLPPFERSQFDAAGDRAGVDDSGNGVRVIRLALWAQTVCAHKARRITRTPFPESSTPARSPAASNWDRSKGGRLTPTIHASYVPVRLVRGSKFKVQGCLTPNLEP